MVNPVSCPADLRPDVMTFPQAVTPVGGACVVTDESWATDNEVEKEAEHLHGDGHQEEDECVYPLVTDHEFSEDTTQRDDYTCCTWREGGEEREERISEDMTQRD